MGAEHASLADPVPGDSPCGPDLSLGDEFRELEEAAQGTLERVLGDNVIPAKEPEWDDVSRRAEALLLRSKDLRIAVIYVRALIRTQGLAGLAAGLSLLSDLLDGSWEGLHPQLDPDDRNDPIARLNTLAVLSAADGVMRDLRAAPVVRPGPYGRLSVRDVLLAAGKLQPRSGDTVLNEASLTGILADAGRKDIEQLGGPAQALEQAQALQRVLVERFGESEGANLVRPMRDVLRVVADACAKVRSALQPAAETPRATANPDIIPPAAGAPSPAIAIGELRTREQAVRMLDQVCDFVERTEPTNPAPLLIRRARKLMTMSFLDIVQDLAPEGMAQVRVVAGIPNESAQ